MKKLLALSLATITLSASKIGVSIGVQEQIIKELMPNAKVITLLAKGQDPHTYEPKPKDMLEFSKADLYFSIGVEVEEVWLKKLAENTKVKIIASDKGVKKMPYSHEELEEHHHDHHHEHSGDEHHHHDHHHDHHHEHSDDEHHHHDHHHHDEHHHDHHHDHHHHEHSGDDVHIWTSIKNLKIIASNMTNALIKKYPEQKKQIQSNFYKYEDKLKLLDQRLKNLLADTKIKGFISSHPSWGYFAKDYQLKEYTLELDGKEIKPKQLAKIINIAKDKKACLILKAPQFSDNLAKTIQKESDLNIVSIDPLADDFLQELLKFATLIHNNCN